MPSLYSIQFDTSEWELVKQLEDYRLWKNDTTDFLSLNFFSIPPDIPANLTDLTGLQNFYRQGVLQNGGGLVSVDVLSVKGVSTVKTMFKFPQQPTGMRYLASLTFPFAEFSYVIKVDCLEYGTTGTRDSLVYVMHASKFKPDNPLEGWFQDPYDPTRKDPIMRNPSEDEQYDAEFPEHPLSRARRYLAHIETNIEFSSEVLLSSPFYVSPEQS